MLKRKYNRIFILLNGINEGLSENINGSCDIEIINGRAKLYAYVGGMGRLKEKERTVYLISAGIKGSLAIPAGKLERKGTNAVLETSFDPDDIFGSGVCVEDINTAAVWNDSESPTRAVLEGFVSHKVSWLKNLEIFGTEGPVIINEEKSDEKTAEKIESKILEFEKNAIDMQEEKKAESHIQLNEDIKENIKENISENSGTVYDETIGDEAETMEETSEKEDETYKIDNEDNIDNTDNTELQAAEAAVEQVISPHDTFRMIAEKFRRELDMLDEMGILDKSVILGENNGDKSDKTLKKTEKMKAVDDIKEKAQDIRQPANEKEMLFEKNEKLNVGGGTLWVKADYREMYFIPSAIVELRKLFVKNGARKGNHVIAGKNNGKYYIGIPGSENQRKDAENNGYYDFLSVNEKGSEGYWIKELEN